MWDAPLQLKEGHKQSTKEYTFAGLIGHMASGPHEFLLSFAGHMAAKLQMLFPSLFPLKVAT